VSKNVQKNVSKIARFAAYAAAFEKAYASDDWTQLEPFFTENAVYAAGIEPPVGGTIEGREQVFAFFKQVTDRFDKRFESREIALLEGPQEEGDGVWIRGSASYRAPGVPTLVLRLKEIARFEGDRIYKLEDHFEPAMQKEIFEYLQQYGEKLGIRAE
jgi:hypothetical protein